MSTYAPMPMRLMGSVAPELRVRAPWSLAVAPVSAGLGYGSPFTCVTTGTHPTQATDINTKGHGARRLLETPT